VFLSLGVLAMSGVCLLTTMKVAGWSWNLLNLMGLPLILGTGVDYSIFMQLALRRHGGDLEMAHRSVGRALMLCGATAIAGFGSLAWSSNAGMASLGKVCAAGIAGNMLISVLLLPVWWKWCTAETVQRGASLSPKRRVSLLYRTELWRLGLWVARLLPARFSEQLGRAVAWIYWMLARHRREVVIQNLLPPLNGDLPEARRTAKRLFGHFAVKLVDLWRFEAGLPIDPLFGQYTGWEHFLKAHEEKRGVLLLTTHLGNWEFGGPWLTRHGFTLTVITLPEPAAALTQLRQASRAKWDIETLVIGEDPFAFVEIIRRLEAGAVVALLVDRPPARSAVTVELFGRPFEGSIAAAELARASGCALIPVYLPRRATKYEAHVQPPIRYDRAALRSAEARQRLTQQILRAFEEGIRQNLDQWYHFVPIWPGQDGQAVHTAADRKRVPGAMASQSSSPQPSV
jgi:lauroyl/myristoyl acyltransferase